MNRSVQAAAGCCSGVNLAVSEAFADDVGGVLVLIHAQS